MSPRQRGILFKRLHPSVGSSLKQTFDPQVTPLLIVVMRLYSDIFPPISRVVDVRFFFFFLSKTLMLDFFFFISYLSLVLFFFLLFVFGSSSFAYMNA